MKKSLCYCWWVAAALVSASVNAQDTRPFNMPSAERMDKELQRLAEAKIIEQHLRERRNGLARK